MFVYELSGCGFESSCREFECLGENTKKYITFSVPIKTQITKIDKDGNDKISYKIKFIDSFRFMSSSEALITADMINNKRLNPLVIELFIRGRKLGISIVFITQLYFKVPKDVSLNSTHFFIMKIPNKRELQQIALNHSSDIDFKDFIKIYRKCTAEPY